MTTGVSGRLAMRLYLSLLSTLLLLNNTYLHTYIAPGVDRSPMHRFGHLTQVLIR